MNLIPQTRVQQIATRVCRKAYRSHEKKLLEIINEFIKVIGYKINIEKSIVFSNLAMKMRTQKFKNQYHLHVLKKCYS